MHSNQGMNNEIPDFDSLRVRWWECARSQDSNSIEQQLNRIVWRRGFYRAIARANRPPPSNEQGENEVSEPLAHFIRSCFFESQGAALRRVVGGELDVKHDLTHKRATWSLRSLIADMQRNRCVLTRINLLKECPDWFRESQESDFDYLAEVEASSRKDADIVRGSVLESLDTRLANEIKNIQLWVDKAIAHAASSHSRRVGGYEPGNVTNTEMMKTEELVCRVFSFLNRYLLSHKGLSLLPVWQGDLFSHASTPLFPTDRITDVESEWSEFEKLTRGWVEGAWRPT